MNIIREYIKYIIKAKGRHHIHSPFVFNLVDVCFKEKVCKQDYNILYTFLDKINSNKKKYDFDQFGAGSRNKKKYTSVKQFSNNARSKGKYWNLLYRLSKHYKPNSILELGTNFGFGILAFKLGNPNVLIHSIEGSKTIHDITNKNLNQLNFEKINLYNLSFNDYFKLNNSTIYDLIFIDGDHIGTHLLHNLENILPNCHNETIIVVDDIRWSTDMFNAWKQIMADKRFNLTIDLFKLGIILLKPDKEKEHFIIRY